MLENTQHYLKVILLFNSNEKKKKNEREKITSHLLLQLRFQCCHSTNNIDSTSNLKCFRFQEHKNMTKKFKNKKNL